MAMWNRNDPIRSLDDNDPDDDDLQLRAGPKASGLKDEDGLRVAERVNVGKSVVIKGELNASEDLTIEGRVEGKIEMRQHVLTIGPNGKIKAQVHAKSVVVLGEVNGNVTATDKVCIRENASVNGDLVAPRVAIAEGAHFRGNVDMQRADAPAAAANKKGQGGGKGAPAAASSGAGSGSSTHR